MLETSPPLEKSQRLPTRQPFDPCALGLNRDVDLSVLSSTPIFRLCICKESNELDLVIH